MVVVGVGCRGSGTSADGGWPVRRARSAGAEKDVLGVVAVVDVVVDAADA